MNDEMRRLSIKERSWEWLGVNQGQRICLACGKPLYGPELLHTPPKKAEPKHG